MTVRDIVQAAAGVSTGNPNAWDISKFYFDNPNAGKLSTTTANNNIPVGSQTTLGMHSVFSADGKYFYLVGRNNPRQIYQYSTTTPFQVGGYSYVQSYDLSTDTSSPNAIYFKPDGTRLFVADDGNNRINEYSLSTPWDVSTLSYVTNYSVATEDTTPRGIYFKPDGTSMYISGDDGNDVTQYNLSTAWDISTATSFQTFSTSAQNSSMRGLSFLGDGTKMFLTGYSNPRLYEYNLSTPWDISTASNVDSYILYNSMYYAEGVYMTPEGSAFLITTQLNESGVSDYRIYGYTCGGLTFAARDSNPIGIYFKPDGTKMYFTGYTNDRVYEYDLSTAWDLNTLTYVQQLTISAQATQPMGLFFSTDGTSMFVLNETTDQCLLYTLSTAWDISTAVYNSALGLSGVGLTSPWDLYISNDGLNLYITGRSQTSIYQYSLSTPWSFVGASFVRSLSVSSSFTNPTGIYFKPNGTKMYVGSQATDSIHEFDLSTPWDISTAVISTSTGVIDTAPQGLYFNESGENFFVVGTVLDRILKFSVLEE